MRTCDKPGCGYPVFGTDKKTGKGFCKSHQYLRTDTDRRTSAQKIVAKIKNDATLKNFDNDLEKWFVRIEKEIAKDPRCRECNEPIPEKYYRHAVAHLLPKKTFLSVATHPLNYMILGRTCPCHEKTHRWDQMQKLKCFSAILDRLIMIEPDVAQSERKNLPQFLLDAVAENNFLIDKK